MTARVRTDISVETLGDLACAYVAPLREGCLAWVEVELDYFELEKSSGAAPDGINVVSPLSGAPIAGAADARWVRLSLAAGGAPATPFRMIGVPNASTSSVAFVDLLAVPGGVDVTVAGDVLLDFDASAVVIPPPGAATTQGINFQFMWDGAPLPDAGFYEFDPGALGTLVDSMGFTVRFRSLIVGAAPGNHTLSVQWSVDDATSTGSTFVGSGNLTIQSAPQ